MSTSVSSRVDGGLPGPIGETLGAFEPRFYGVSFLLETPAMFKEWILISGLSEDSTKSDLPVFESSCLRTAIEHEIRHFHDALVSPFANRIMMLRMMAAFNGGKVFNRSHRLGADCLPIPAKTWMAKNQKERADWMAEVAGEFQRPLHPPPFPYLDGTDPPADMKPGLYDQGDDDLETALQAFAKFTIGAYTRAAELMRGPLILLRTDPRFHSVPEEQKRSLEAIYTPRNVFEVSALAVQLQAAWTNLGADSAGALLEFFTTSDLGYAHAFRQIAKTTAKGGSINLNHVSAVAVWCLLTEDDPAADLLRLTTLLNNSDGVAASQSVATVWDDWDTHFKRKGWRTAVREMRERTARSIENYVALRNRPDEQVASLVTVLEAYLEDQTRATSLLLSDPDAYVDTLRYVESTRTELPVPLMSIELGDDFIAPVDTFPVNDAVRLPRVFDKDGTRGWNRAVVDAQRPPRPALLDAVLDLEFACKLCDLAFSDEAIRPIDREILLESLKANGMVPVFVF